VTKVVYQFFQNIYLKPSTMAQHPTEKQADAAAKQNPAKRLATLLVRVFADHKVDVEVKK